MKFTDANNKDEIDLRFGYCDQTGKLIARPLYLTECQLAELGKEAAKVPEIRKLLKSFATKLGNLSARVAEQQAQPEQKRI